MAGKKKTSDTRPIVKDDPSRIIQTTMEDVMHSSMIPYAEHVILERALPRVEDGLKPVQRRILYTMLELGTTPDKPHRKCARIVGDCLGKYHPHGDSSVYGALVRMAQEFAMRGPMVDGHGNFGSIDGDGAAAMRYTEARMTPLAMLMLRDIEKDTVSFSLNFDDTLKEPDILPANFPNLLVNGADGIAVGLATNIPTHNIGETIRAAIAQIEDPDISLDDLMKIIPGPDFPTGGVLVDNDQIRLGYETGRSKLSVRARVHVEDGLSGRKLLVISEIPYQVNKAAMLTKIQKLTEEKKNLFSGIYDIRDESDREGMRAVIELRKDADVDKTLAALYKYSDMQVTFGVNMVAIADGKPMTLSLKQVIGYFIKHQKDVVTRRTQFDLKQAEARAHILEGLMIAVDNLDEVIRLIRASKTPKDARAALMAAFGLDEVQAQAILDMRLQRLTNLEILSLRKEFEELQKLIAKLKGILASEKKLLAVIRRELEEIANEYSDERRTTIEKVGETAVEVTEAAPAAEEATVAYTWGGQLKRMYPKNYEKTPLPSAEENRNESPRFLFNTKTDRSLYIFTDLGNCFVLNVGALPEIKPKERGSMLSGVLAGLEDNEKAVFMTCLKPDEMAQQPDLLFFTAGGMVKRSKAEEYAVRSKKFAAINLKKGDRLIAVVPVSIENDALIVTKNGMAIRFALSEVSVTGRTTAGVKAVSLEESDEILLAAQIGGKDCVTVISERGFAKRIPAMDFEAQSRGGKGVHIFPFKRTGINGRYLAGVCLTGSQPCRFLITQAKSPVSVLSADEIPLQKKTDQGRTAVMAILDDVVTGMTALGAKK